MSYSPGNPENRHVINISVNALKTHVDHHEDYIGECYIEVTSVTYYQYSVDGIDWSEWNLIDGSITLDNIDLGVEFGVGEVFVRFKDEASNISQVYSDTININSSNPEDPKGSELPTYRIEYYYSEPYLYEYTPLTYSLDTIPSTIENGYDIGLIFTVKIQEL
ncbi:MAG: hypothetical protein Q9M91_02935 [Candidatus Dojkabacteria bacterium]|nr:hypothetical protein [Candidatus Dojkabacteria bacterium]